MTRDIYGLRSKAGYRQPEQRSVPAQPGDDFGSPFLW
jgi:hypothetical protein